MAAIATKKILDSMEWAKKMNFNRQSAIGNFLEPALTSANIVMQSILGPPFDWWWNNEVKTFTCVAGQQDYIVNSPEFGHIESASVQTLGSPSNWMQLEVKNSLSLDATAGRPRFLSPHSQDPTTGDVTFRLMPAPDKVYPVSITIQNAAPLLNSVNDLWSPIPDYMGHIYNWGFLAMMYMFADDPRFAVANQKFVAHLLGAAQGLTEQEKNIFFNNWNNLTGLQQQQNAQGVQARGV
jgi:hypothetical protein